ncbi:MAG: hypothetical protein IJ724_03880 [Muribaculaceae bacterium]|nr:hypothetical protein [Muribaculaceae bacterium]
MAFRLVLCVPIVATHGHHSRPPGHGSRATATRPPTATQPPGTLKVIQTGTRLLVVTARPPSGSAHDDSCGLDRLSGLSDLSNPGSGRLNDLSYFNTARPSRFGHHKTNDYEA